MSRRGVRWVVANGGLQPIIGAARTRGVHLLQLTDDQGTVLIAASTTPSQCCVEAGAVRARLWNAACGALTADAGCVVPGPFSRGRAR